MSTLLFLAAWAIRSSILIAAGALLLQVLRVKDPAIRLAAWTGMLAGSLAIPLLTATLPHEIMRIPAPREANEITPEPISSESLPQATIAPAARPFDWARVGLVVYIAIAGALLLRVCVGLVGSLRWLRASRPTGRTIGGIEICESDRVSAPVTLGILRPAIVLPNDWTQWDATKLDAVLAHERSHIERRDPAVQLLSAAHRALLWHSPLSWFLHRRIVRVAEEVSDDAAIASTQDRAAYAEVLLDFMQRPWRVRGLPMARYGRADERIGRILSSTTLTGGVTRWGAAAIVALGSPLAYVVAAAQPQSAPVQERSAPQAMPKPATPTPPETKPARAPAFFEGLGYVAATTVAIKPRVTGQLTSVNFKEGDAVEAGQLLATIDAQPYQIQLDQVEGQLAREQAHLAEVMLAKNMTPSDQFQSMVAQLEGTIKSAQANVDQAKVQLSYTQIRAPISGVTGLRQVDVGNMVYAAADATPIVVITQRQPIAVLFDVPQDILPQLQARIREGASVTAEAWDNNMNKKYATGFLSAVDNQIDTKTGMVKLKATFSNNDRALFPNEFVIMRLLMTR